MEAETRISYEREIIGALLRDPITVLPLVEPILNGGGAFRGPGLRAVYQAIGVLGPATSLNALRHSLDELTLKAVGGISALSAIEDEETEQFVSNDRVKWAAEQIAAAGERDDAIATVDRIRQRFASEEDPSEVLADLQAQLARVRPSKVNRFLASQLSAADFAAREFPARQTLLGKGLLTTGGFALLYGQAGLGKSYASLQLAHASATGGAWFGLPCNPARVGVVSLELEGDQLQHRMRAIHGEHPPRTLHLLCRETLRGLVDLAQAREQRELIEFVRDLGLHLLILDPMSRIHCLEETAAELGSIVLPFLDRLRLETGAAVLVVHHERKPASDARRGDEDDLSAIRGTSRLSSDPTLALRLVRRRDGHLQLRCAKSNHAPMFDPIWLEQSPQTSLLYAVDPPEGAEAGTKGSAAKLAVLAALQRAGGAWLSSAEIAEASGVHYRSVRRCMNEIAGLETSGSPRSPNLRFRLPKDSAEPDSDAPF